MSFLKRIENSFHTRTGAYVFYALAIIALMLLRSADRMYYWIEEKYPLGDNFLPTLFAVLYFCAAANLGFLFFEDKIKNSVLRGLHTALCVLTGILCGYTLVLAFGFDKGFDTHEIQQGFLYLKPHALLLLVLTALPIAFAVYSDQKKALRATLIGIICASVAFPLGAAAYKYALRPIIYPEIKFTSAPIEEPDAPPKYSIADYNIVYAKGASPVEINSAGLLAEYLNEITGLDYAAKQAEPSGTKEIIVGQFSGEDVSDLGEEGFLIKSEGENIIITGGNPRGTIYGVFHFLEKYFGCRWYTRELRLIPAASAEIPEVETERFVPPIEFRQTEWLTRNDYTYSAANRLNDNVARNLPAQWGGSIGYYGPFCHTITSWLVSAEKFFSDHPDWFAYREEQNARVPKQLCLTNPEVFDQMLLEVREHLAKGNKQFNGKRFLLSITQEDNFDFCQCPNCKAIDEKEESNSGTMLRFVNAIAEAVEDEYPNAIIDTFAYQYTRTPPKYVRPRKNVAVRLCSIECCFAHPLNDPDCPDNISFADDIKTWSEICEQLYVWDYTNNYSHYSIAFPNFHVLQKNIQFFTEHNVTGVYEEGNHQSEENHSEFNELKGYIISRLMYDPYLDFDAEMNGFLKAYYGEGWQYIREFIDLICENTGTPDRTGSHRKLHIFCSPTDKALYNLKPNQVLYADMLWEKAIELSGSEALENNVRRSQLSWRFWKGCNKVSEFSRLQWPGKWINANEQLFSDFEAFGITLYHEKWSHDAGALKRPDNWRGTPEDWH